VRADGVWKRFRLYHERHQTLKEAIIRRKRGVYEELWALRDVSFAIEPGQTVGIIGENGSGKSTLLKCVARILSPDQGEMSVEGRLGALLELGAGFHPELTGRENVYLNGSILGFGRKEIAKRFDEIVSFAELERFIDMQVKNYSSGMYVRLGFAIATLLEPDVLLVDEILAVGDESFQRKSKDKFYEFRSSGRTIVVVSHDLATLRTLCDRILFLHHGELAADGAAAKVIDTYLETVTPSATAAPAAGAGAVSIADVEVRSSAGRPADVVRSGEAVDVVIRYACAEPVERPVFVVEVVRQDGVQVAVSHSKMHGMELPQIGGEGSVSYRIASLPLVAGRYWISAAILDQSLMHTFARADRVRSIDVRGSSDPAGLLQLDGAWTAGAAVDIT
jgi:ABC-2 type transport system ATP-binding protein